MKRRANDDQFLRGTSPVRLLSLDLNGTLVGNPESTARFTASWNDLNPVGRPSLVYTCGRSVREIQRVVNEHKLPEPTAMIGGLGTSMEVKGHDREAAEFNARYQTEWDFDRIDKLFAGIAGMVREASTFLHPYKSEWRWRNTGPERLRQLRFRLADCGIKATVTCTDGERVDVVPAGTNKGMALGCLCSLLAVPLDAVLVAGDSLHDASMLLLPKVKRIVVDNSLPDLLAELVGLEKFYSPRVMADGVMDGLRHFGVLPSTHR
jgi:hydroxymethylpyrimidine pyrophosphatase-like HAD family hydrolase